VSRGSYIRTIISSLSVFAKFGLSLGKSFSELSGLTSLIPSYTAYFGKSLKLKSIVLAFSRIHNLSVAINATAAAGDIVIAATMLHLLYTSRSGISQTDSIINRLMVRPIAFYFDHGVRKC